jgi:dihydroorotate dehydrogenase electron transfer subunit
MAKQHLLSIAEQRPLAQGLHRTELIAPELSAARAGQFLMLRCAHAGAADPFLRRACYVSAVDRSRGSLALLLWHGALARYISNLPPGATVDAIGLLGQPFVLEANTRTLLLIGSGWGTSALLLLAHEATRRGCAVTLVATGDAVPPPFLLPPEVEYHALPALFGNDQQPAGFDLQRGIAWADQVCAAVGAAHVGPLAEAVRGARFRWGRGFAQAALDAPVACGMGVCTSCAIETRRGWQLTCVDGPFDLRDLLAT